MKGISRIFLMICGLIVCQTAGAEKAATAGGESFEIRAWHCVLRGVPVEAARRMVDKAASAGFNVVQVQVTDGVSLEASPWRPGRNAWTKAEFSAWIAYAREKGLSIVPELKLLTHQEKFLQGRFSDLMYNRSTYDPRQHEVYERVFPVIDEVIALTEPEAVHIGHDEVAGYKPYSAKKWLNDGEEMLPASLFLKDIERLHEFLKSRGVDTWMWGDMLISPQEFPQMSDRPLHGIAPGYGKALRERLPREIVICDWHYSDDQEEFPSLSTMQEEGFRVIGATWQKETTIRNFSRFAASRGAYGMMATSWSPVQKGEWSVVDRIIDESGRAFMTAFQNAR